METVINGYGTLMEGTLAGTKYVVRYLQAYVSCGLHAVDLTHNFQKIIYIIFIDLTVSTAIFKVLMQLPFA